MTPEQRRRHVAQIHRLRPEHEVPQMIQPKFHTRKSLRQDLQRLGVGPGDLIMVHAAVSKVGPLLNGPDALIAALIDAAGEAGTIMAYTDWDGNYDSLLDPEGCVPPEWREHVPPFDPASSRAVRDNGILAEFLRTTPGARRSGNPGASVAAIGARADWITADHPLNYGYGEASPFAKLVQANGKVLMVGAPLGTMTLLHHAEHLAQVPDKKIRRYEVPLRTSAGASWQRIEEFETSAPVISGLPDDYFAKIVSDFLATGRGQQGTIGNAPSVLVEADAMCRFAVTWIERVARAL